jgi:hypothetical protein
MKAIKIILAVAVVAAIGFFVREWLVAIDKPKDVSPPQNQFTARIESEIDLLKEKPANVFCSKFYEAILYHIIDYHKQGFLGNSGNDNNEWRNILSKSAYDAYAEKFAEQAMYVFNGSSWEINKIDFIRSEVKTLQAVKDQDGQYRLDASGSVGASFKTICDILAKHDEIAGFISTCNNFSCSNYSLMYFFPDVSDKVQKSRAYLANNLGNSYANNCTRLKDDLRTIPQTLLNKHAAYLRAKIRQNGGKYTDRQHNFYQSDYSNNIYMPLRYQIESINSDVYGIDVETAQDKLLNLLSAYNKRANKYYRSRRY